MAPQSLKPRNPFAPPLNTCTPSGGVPSKLTLSAPGSAAPPVQLIDQSKSVEWTRAIIGTGLFAPNWVPSQNLDAADAPWSTASGLSTGANQASKSFAPGAMLN